MFMAEYRHTMASAKRIVPDTAYVRRTPRLAALMRASIAWQRQFEESRRRDMAFFDRAREVTRLAEERRIACLTRLSALIVPPSNAKTIIARVAAWHGVTAEDIIGPSRIRPIVAARFDAVAAVFLNCRFGGRAYSTPDLGRAFGGRDHTTILHALRHRGLK